jgi:hypothetical protein
MPYKLVGHRQKDFIRGHIASREKPGSDGASPYQPVAYDVTPLLIGPRQSTKEFLGGDTARQDDPESPGSDRASPYQPTVASPTTLCPTNWSANRQKKFIRGHIARQDHAKSPVRTEPHPTNPLLTTSLPYKLVRANRQENSEGLTPQGRMTRKAPVRTEPHPTNPRCLAYDVISYKWSTN